MSPGTNVPQLKRSIGFRDLVLFNVSAVLSLRWIATAAKTGPHALTLWVLAMLMFFIFIIASKARFPSAPPAESASISTRGVICQEMPQRSLHQPHWLSAPPSPTIAFQ